MSVTHISPAAMASSAAEAALAVLPAAASLTAGDPVSDPAAGSIQGTTIVSTLTGPVSGHVAVTVNQELVDALRTSPLGDLDLVTAIAPALDAVASVVGSVAGAGQELAPDAALTAMAAAGELLVVPLTAEDGETHAAIVLSLPAPEPASAPSPVVEALPSLPKVSGLDLLHGVDMEITVELGRTSMTVRDLLSLSNGSVLELDRTAGSPADVLVNRRLIARGEVVVIDEYFGIRITEILASADRHQQSA